MLSKRCSFETYASFISIKSCSNNSILDQKQKQKTDKLKVKTADISGSSTNDKYLSPKPTYDKSRIMKGSPNKKKLEKKVRKMEKKKAEMEKKQSEIVEKNAPAEPVGKRIKKIPRYSLHSCGTHANKETRPKTSFSQ